MRFNIGRGVSNNRFKTTSTFTPLEDSNNEPEPMEDEEYEEEEDIIKLEPITEKKRLPGMKLLEKYEKNKKKVKIKEERLHKLMKSIIISDF